jgi:hypothetical protein
LALAVEGADLVATAAELEAPAAETAALAAVPAEGTAAAAAAAAAAGEILDASSLGKTTIKKRSESSSFLVTL